MNDAPFKLLQIIVIFVFAFSVICNAANEESEEILSSSDEPKTVQDLYSTIYVLIVQKKNYMCPLCTKLAPLTEADPPDGRKTLAEIQSQFKESDIQNVFFELVRNGSYLPCTIWNN